MSFEAFRSARPQPVQFSLTVNAQVRSLGERRPKEALNRKGSQHDTHLSIPLKLRLQRLNLRLLFLDGVI